MCVCVLEGEVRVRNVDERRRRGMEKKHIDGGLSAVAECGLGGR